jgi:ankyrin repeat protein
LIGGGAAAGVGGRPELVHAADKRGNQPIHWAVLTRQIGLIDYLLSRGADIMAKRPDGARPLDLTNGDYFYRSSYRDLPATGLQEHEVLIGYLMARGAYCDISVAAKIGWYDRVKELLDADPGLANRLPDYVIYYSGLPLRNAAAAGHLEVVKLLLERGARPNEPEPGIAPFGGALHSAVGGRHYAIAKLLLEHGANANAMVESSGDVLSMARHVKASQEMIDLIAAHVTNRDPDIIAYEADAGVLEGLLRDDPAAPVEHWLGRLIDQDLQPQLELILRHQPDILRRQTMLSAAWWDSATFASAGQARWLLERGLNPRLRNWLGITMLHRCAAKGRVDVAEVLLEFGADPNAVETEWSSTPMGWAARHGQKEMVFWLLSQGADPWEPDDKSWAWPEDWARRKGFKEIVDLLKTEEDGEDE